MLSNLFEILVVAISFLTVLLALYQNKIYFLPLWKLMTVVLCGAVGSFAGIYLLAYFEHGYWYRWSFFGCVFLVPILYYGLGKVIKVPYSVLMDFAGPVCALFFALIKINCAVKGCCGGICVYSRGNISVILPIQIIEIIGGAAILVLLLRMQKNKTKRGKLAPIFLLLFGLLRFALSFLREEIVYLRFLRDIGVLVPATRLWPFVCIVWGCIWMYRIVSKHEGRKATIKEVVAEILEMFRFRSREEVS